jgi:hypothetical protein
MIPPTAEGDALDAAVRASADDDEAARLAYARWLARAGCREQARLIASDFGPGTAAFCREHGVPVRVVLDMEAGAVAGPAAAPEHYRAVAVLMRSNAGRACVFRALIGEVTGEAIAALADLADLLRRAAAAPERPKWERAAVIDDMTEAAGRICAALRRLSDAHRAEILRPAIY